MKRQDRRRARVIHTRRHANRTSTCACFFDARCMGCARVPRMDRSPGAHCFAVGSSFSPLACHLTRTARRGTAGCRGESYELLGKTLSARSSSPTTNPEPTSRGDSSLRSWPDSARSSSRGLPTRLSCPASPSRDRHLCPVTAGDHAGCVRPHRGGAVPGDKPRRQIPQEARGGVRLRAHTNPGIESPNRRLWVRSSRPPREHEGNNKPDRARHVSLSDLSGLRDFRCRECPCMPAVPFPEPEW